MYKERMINSSFTFDVAVFFVILLFACFSFVSATPGVTMTDVSGTVSTIRITGADNLYSYEINIDYGGANPSVTSSDYLTIDSGDATYGSSAKSNIISVYGSRLDSGLTGKTGSGELFNLTHLGSASLRYALFISASGTETYVYYNASSEGETTPGGNNGGGGSKVPAGNTTDTTIGSETDAENLDLTFSIDSLNVNAIIGDSVIEDITINNNAQKAVNLNMRTEGFALLDIPIKLAAGESKSFDLPISPNVEGLIVGRILFIFNGLTIKEIPVLVNARTSNFLFDTSLVVAERSREINKGELLITQINLQEIGENKNVDVEATYFIKDYAGTVYFQQNETIIVSGSKEITKEFDVSMLPPGKYVLAMELVYPGAFATSSAQFEVVGSGSYSQNQIIGGIIAAILGVAVIVLAYWIIKKKK